MSRITGDQIVQDEVLEGLAEAHNHRRWFAGLALPYLGAEPIEIGSGLGDYAAEWAPHVRQITVTEAEPGRLVDLKERFGADDRFRISETVLPTDETAEHSALVSFNVLEHIVEHVEALRSMARLVRPGAPIILVVPAFPGAMSPVDIATGHVRRYTRASMGTALTEAGLTIERLEYVNSTGLICYYATAKLLRLAPRRGPLIKVYDGVVAPLTCWFEKRVRPPFGQSVFAVARTSLANMQYSL